MSESKQEIIAKIQKLLRLSQSNNEHEAKLAAQRANELMEKYQIESSALEVVAFQAGTDNVVEELVVVDGLKMKLHWVTTLAQAAAALFDGTILVFGSELHGTSFKFVGFKTEIPLMKELFNHLYASWPHIADHDLQIAKREFAEDTAGQVNSYGVPYRWQPRHTMKFKHGHGQGYAAALYQRCRDLADARKVKVASVSTALVLIRNEAVSTYLTKKGCKTVRQHQTRGASDGYQAGSRAGRSIALGGAIAG